MTTPVSAPVDTLPHAPLATAHGVVRLPHLGVIRATGADAASFLQGQLTQDVLTMALGESRLAAFCSAKGRVQATFQVLKRVGSDAQPEFLLICSRDLAAAAAKRLSMFVMRAKARLSDESDALAVYGATFDASNSVAADTQPTGATASFSEYSVVNFPAVAGLARTLYVGAAGAVDFVEVPVTPFAASVSTLPTLTLTLDYWLWLEVMSGIARVTATTADAFVPQMLNYESLGGVNFKKGCYPGQEVVARSQFRGTLKRRAYCVEAPDTLAMGDEVFGPADAEQACGSVVLAAQAPVSATGGGPFNAIVSMQVSAAITGGLTAKSPTGAELTLLPLPYVLLDDI